MILKTGFKETSLFPLPCFISSLIVRLATRGLKKVATVHPKSVRNLTLQRAAVVATPMDKQGDNQRVKVETARTGGFRYELPGRWQLFLDSDFFAFNLDIAALIKLIEYAADHFTGGAHHAGKVLTRQLRNNPLTTLLFHHL